MRSCSGPRWILFSIIIKAACLISLLVLCCALPVKAVDQPSSRLLSRPEFALSRRHELADQLRRITGLKGLDFDEHGALSLGNIEPVGGSKTARELLAEAITGRNMIVLEDASKRQDVVFCRVIEGRWKHNADQKPPVHILLIDFADFSHVVGDKVALAAFNVGWAVLHEIEHVVYDSVDPVREGEVGECETLVNKMRRECGLAERAEYFYSYFPGTNEGMLMIKIVRLAFDKLESGKRKRHWIVWDANLVGGVGRNVSVVSSR